MNRISMTVQILTGLLLVGFGLYLIQNNHGDFVLWLNERHSSFTDVFFMYWTYVGDGFLLGIISLFFLFTSYHRFSIFLIAIAFQTLFVHIFKQWLAKGEPRPKLYFEAIIDQLQFVDGVAVRSFNSFPSGHTASAFTLCFFLMLLTKRTVIQLLLLVSAVLVGVSRVYILQHFGRDILFGAIFGILSVLLGVWLMKPYTDSPKLHGGLLKR